MPSRYSVIQYVPDVVTDERINIGVIAFDEEEMRVAFLKRWGRVRRFATTDVDFLEDFAEDLEQAVEAREQLPGISGVEPLTPDKVERMAGSWMNVIQLTQPRGSLDDLQTTFDWARSRFLTYQSRGERPYRTRRSAAAIAKASVREALHDKLGRVEAELYLKPSQALPGKRKLHMFDGVVMNGKPYYAVHGVSFELPEARILNLQLDALAWAVADVRDLMADLPIGIVALPPKVDSGRTSKQLYQQSVGMYRDLGAEVLTETTVDAWALQMSARVPSSGTEHPA